MMEGLYSCMHGRANQGKREVKGTDLCFARATTAPFHWWVYGDATRQDPGFKGKL